MREQIQTLNVFPHRDYSHRCASGHQLLFYIIVSHNQLAKLPFLPHRISQPSSQLSSLPCYISQPTNFQTWVIFHFCLVSEWCHIHSFWFHTCAEDLGPPVFSIHFLITVVIHLWLDDQQVLWPGSPEVNWLFHRLSAFFFFFFFFCFFRN